VAGEVPCRGKPAVVDGRAAIRGAGEDFGETAFPLCRMQRSRHKPMALLIKSKTAPYSLREYRYKKRTQKYFFESHNFLFDMD
jgi:hypothetical protein